MKFWMQLGTMHIPLYSFVRSFRILRTVKFALQKQMINRGKMDRVRGDLQKEKKNTKTVKA